MRSFILGCIAALAIAVVAALVLDAVQEPVDTAFTTVGVRL